jgi:hypothetical protein
MTLRHSTTGRFIPNPEGPAPGSDWRKPVQVLSHDSNTGAVQRRSTPRGSNPAQMSSGRHQGTRKQFP